MYGDDSLDRFEGTDGQVTKVITESGRELEADAVVIGAGVSPDVTLARNAGLELGESGGVRVDSRLQTQVPGLFAGGDIAAYDSVIHGRPIRVEHWDVAFNHGKTAALNMLGRQPAPRCRSLLLLRPLGLGVAGVRRARAPVGPGGRARVD